ncbi:hypothetical protein C8R44DRAFT_224050 [Mycena epipterygia]|nr:hypothetical protein C8R44DRAFT_224050 [Mycena epipterygia]
MTSQHGSGHGHPGLPFHPSRARPLLNGIPLLPSPPPTPTFLRSSLSFSRIAALHTSCALPPCIPRRHTLFAPPVTGIPILRSIHLPTSKSTPRLAILTPLAIHVPLPMSSSLMASLIRSFRLPSSRLVLALSVAILPPFPSSVVWVPRLQLFHAASYLPLSRFQSAPLPPSFWFAFQKISPWSLCNRHHLLLIIHVNTALATRKKSS